MMAMDTDWQTGAALGVVLATIAILAWRQVRRSKKATVPGCGHDCGCGTKKDRLAKSQTHQPGK